MSPKIYNIKEPLNLERLRLAKPTNKNGSYFIKTLDVDDPIYFLGPKCFSKHGFVKSGKKVFCDFVFSNEDSDFLAWLDNLEESARKCIYDNRETWFEVPLDEHDIESSMSSPYKPYKSGKYFIVRANVPTALDKINIKVYDENETETDPENIKENTKVLAVLEFQGIRCSVRSFQFEIELKQILIVEPDKLFEKCIIGKATKPVVKEELPLEPVLKEETAKNAGHEVVGVRGLAEEISIGFTDFAYEVAEGVKNAGHEVVGVREFAGEISEAQRRESRKSNSKSEIFGRCDSPTKLPPSVSLENHPIPALILRSGIDHAGASNENEAQRRESRKSNTQETPQENRIHDDEQSIADNFDQPINLEKNDEPAQELVEVLGDADFTFDDITEANTQKEPPLRLKSRNDVYYKLYKEMRQRAKEAKREALANYLEAKRIKTTYLLEDLSESESDDEFEEKHAGH